MESGYDETLALVNKGYTSADITEQLAKLDEAGILIELVLLGIIYQKSAKFKLLYIFIIQKETLS